MRAETKISVLYKRFDLLVREVEEWLKTQSVELCGYSAGAVKRRVEQIIARQALDPFMADEGASECSRANERGPYAGIVFGRDLGHVRITFSERFRCSLLFVVLWLIGLLAAVKALGKRKGNSSAATLIFGVPASELTAGGSDERFVAYCQNAPIQPLANASRLIVAAQGAVHATHARYAQYGRFPVFMLLADCNLLWREAVRFLGEHLTCLFGYFTSSARCSVIALLWQDVAMHAAARSLNRRGLIENVLLTNTNWLQQFLWMTDLPQRSYQTIMMLYSLNSSPLPFRNEPVSMNHPGIRHLRSDKILVWEKDYTRFLRSDGVYVPTETTPPLIWHLPPNKRYRPPRDKIRICAFDVIPTSKQEQKRRGMLGNYHSIETMTAFLNDIVACADAIRDKLCISCHVVVKHKRAPTEGKDSNYFVVVKSLFCERNDVEFAPFDVNLFNLISESHLVVVVPFSSPAYVASYLNTPAIFYDPTGELLPQYPQNPNVYFTNRVEELRLLAEKLICDRLRALKNLTDSG